MVVGQNNAGLVQDSGLLQTVHQVFQGVFQLQIAGNKSLNGHGIGQRFHLVPVFCTHGVVPVVLVVTAESHVVGMEGTLASDVVVHRGLHHLQIRGGPVHGDVQTVVRRFEGVAHIGMG